MQQNSGMKDQATSNSQSIEPVCKRVLVIGAGWVFQKPYLSAFRSVARLGLQIKADAIVDTNKEALSLAGKLLPEARCFRSLGEVEWDNHFDAILCLLPPEATPKTMKSLADLNIPLFVEKPVAETSSDLESLLDIPAFEKTFVAFNRRYCPRSDELRARIAEEDGEGRIEAKLYRKNRSREIFFHDVSVHAFDFVRSVGGAFRIKSASWSLNRTRLDVLAETESGATRAFSFCSNADSDVEDYLFTSDSGRKTRFEFPFDKSKTVLSNEDDDLKAKGELDEEERLQRIDETHYLELGFERELLAFFEVFPSQFPHPTLHDAYNALNDYEHAIALANSAEIR